MDQNEQPHDWDPDRTLEALTYEQSSMRQDESPTQTSLRLFRESLVSATSALCHLAVYSSNERIRMQAAQYVVERGLGQLRDVPAALLPDTGEDPLMALLASSVREYESGTI